MKTKLLEELFDIAFTKAIKRVILIVICASVFFFLLGVSIAYILKIY